MAEHFRFHAVASLGRATIKSPLLDRFGPDGFVDDASQLAAFDDPTHLGTDQATVFERAGARRAIFHDPAHTAAAIVTCGGLCPGLNNVIRSASLELHHNYGVKRVLGIRYGFAGFNPAEGHAAITLDPATVDAIHLRGGTILGSSRGPQKPEVMADFLAKEGINIVLCIGGDGTQRGAFALSQECRKRRMPVSVIGIPKTIDNDVAYCDRSFGYTTALDEASQALWAAHEEARGAYNGIGLVKLMGRDAGFIAAGATLASQEANFCLIPEQPLRLESFLAALESRLSTRHHAVIAVAEGAGQNLFTESGNTDASGNKRYGDIGALLKQKIEQHFESRQIPITLKYIDPSYIIRSVPARTEDAILCDQFGRLAVHAAMAGKTELIVCFTRGNFAHVPSAMVTSTRRRMQLESMLWRGVLSSTGQPASWE